MTTHTITMTNPSESADDGAPTPVLVIAWHPRPEYVGAWRPLAPGDDLLLGRDHDDLVPGALASGRVSRRHARLRVRDVGLVLQDLGSRNGTWLNGARIGEARLATGDVVQVGDVVLVLARAAKGLTPRRDRHLLGVGPGIAALLSDIDELAPRAGTALVLGPPGAGKERVAARIHARSGRRGRLVAVNCAGLGEGVLHSELFGHVRGAFSGAERHRGGLVQEAAGGTLFLDEVGDAPPALQATLLRLLQEHEVRAVGSDQSRRVDVRFVAATNQDLPALVAAGVFRHDLYTRLDRWTIHVPPLEARREDIPSLAAALVERHYGSPVPLTPAVACALIYRPWPGNVRQLDAVCERLAARVTAGGELELPQGWSDAPPPAATAAERTTRRKGERPDREALCACIARANGNLTRAAEALGVSRPTLYRWLREAGVPPDGARSPG
jgi:DNA-binding NtrC family response regulator